MRSVFVTRQIPGPGLEMLKNAGYQIDVFKKDRPITEKELVKALKKKPYDCLLSLLTDPITAKVLEACPTLKIVSNYAVGYNNINIEEAKRRNVAVTNTSGTSFESVAEHTLALMFSLLCRIVEGDRYVRAGRYTGWSPTLLWGSDIAGKTIGLIGAGKIGSRVAEIASKGFGAKVVYYDVVRNDCVEKEGHATFVSSIDDVILQSDIVSIHVPLLPSTHHLIDESRLKRMKRDAVLINTSRGAVIDEKALVEALKKNIIKGAALDVFEFEPKLTKGLAKLSNVILTPHIASSRETTRRDMSMVAAQNIIEFFEGKTPKGVVVMPEKISCVQRTIGEAAKTS